MKKLTALLFALLICASCCVTAFSINSSVSTRSTGCTISNKKGATYIAEDPDGQTHDIPRYKEFHLDYGQKVTLVAEVTDPELLTKNGFDTKGILYANIEYDDGEGVIRNGFTEIENVKPDEPSVGKAAGTRLSSPINYHVLSKDGIEVYAGPSRVYDVVATLPYGTDIEVTHVGTDASSFAYTEVGDVKGWIFHGGASPLAQPVNDTSYYSGKLKTVKKDLELVDLYTITEDETYKVVGDKIPAGTELTFEYFVAFDAACMAFVNYKGTDGWILFDENYSDPADLNCIVYMRDIYYFEKKTPTYSEFNNKSSLTDIKIPAGSTLNANARYNFKMEKSGDTITSYWVLVEYEGKELWINNEGGNYPFYYCYGSYTEAENTEESAGIYKKPSFDSDVLDVVVYGQSVDLYTYTTVDGNSWNYVNFNGIAGWMLDSGFNYKGNSRPHSLRINSDGIITSGVTENFEIATTSPEMATEEETEPETFDNSGSTEVTKQRFNGKMLMAIFIAVCLLGVGAVVGLAVYVKQRDKAEEGKYKKR